MSGISFQFVAQAVDVYLQQVTLPQVRCTPDLLQQLILWHHTIHVLCETRQQAKLDRSQQDWLTRFGHPMIAMIHLEFADGDRRLKAIEVCTWSELTTAQQCPHACHEFVELKWFAQIIICTQIQPPHFVLLQSTSREQENRDGGEGADTLTRSQAVQPGHHHVEHHEVKPLRLNQREGFFSITGR